MLHELMMRNSVKIGAVDLSSESAAARAASTLEDYVVILQKASTRDAASIISLIDARLIE